jgi:hypothetical protein
LPPISVIAGRAYGPAWKRCPSARPTWADRVAGDERARRHPGHERDGEVERPDHAEHAERPQYARVRLVGPELPERHGEAVVRLDLRAVGLDQVDGLLDLRDRLRARLAGLQRHGRGHLHVALGDRGPGTAQERATRGDVRPPPRGLRRAAALDGLRDERGRRRVRTTRHRVAAARVLALERRPVVQARAGDDVGERVGGATANLPQRSFERGVELGRAGAARVRQSGRRHADAPSSCGTAVTAWHAAA